MLARCVGLVVLVALLSLVSSQSPQYCTNISTAGHKFDLTYWISNSPAQAKDRTGTSVYNFALCGPLDQICQDTPSDNPLAGACVSSSPPAVCESWSLPKGLQTRCWAPFKAVPTFSYFESPVGYGLVMNMTGGDYIGQPPTARRAGTSFQITCSFDRVPVITGVIEEWSDNPTMLINMNHCSGCDITDRRHCSAQRDTASINIKVQMMGFTDPLFAFIGGTTQFEGYIAGGSTLMAEGTIYSVANHTFDFLVSTWSGTGKDVGRLSFPTEDTVKFSIEDSQWGCSNTVKRGSSIILPCNWLPHINVLITGSIL